MFNVVSLGIEVVIESAEVEKVSWDTNKRDKTHGTEGVDQKAFFIKEISKTCLSLWYQDSQVDR